MTTSNAVLLPPFLTEAAILHGKPDAGELLKIIARSITEWALDAAPSSEAKKASDNDSVVTVEATEAKKPCKTNHASAKTVAAQTKKPGKAKQASAKTATAKTLASITEIYNNVLAFL